MAALAMAGSEMRMRRISERDVEAVLSGHVPESRPDLAPLVGAIAEYRAAVFASPARPSIDLALLLGPLDGSRISTNTESESGSVTSRTRVRVLSSIAGLGLVAKIALGAGVAVAATAGAGAAGILPLGAQDVFDTAVFSVVQSPQDDVQTIESTVAPSPQEDESTEPGSDEGTSPLDPSSTNHPDNFGGWVSDRAHDPNKDGRTFGQETSEAAQENGNGHGPPEEDRGNNSGTGNNSGNGGGNGKPDGPPKKP